ncbi:MAG: hypothetical protein GF393_04725 [Armatimonadia bacterium]|nr:hypothetical protein [Armatimonadia bacterium]
MALTSIPPHVLSVDEMDRIREAALDLWARVPTRIGRHEEFRAALRDFGCTIDGDRLSFPPAVRETVLGRIEEQREISGPARPAEIASPEIRRLASGQAIYRYDHETDAVCPATTADLARFSHVCDLFPELERAHPTFIPQDVPVHSVDVHAFATILKNSSRLWRTAAFGPGSVEYMIEMMLAAGRDIDEIRSDPIINTTCYYTSPFSIGGDAIGIAMEARRLLGVPFTIHTMPVMGLSTPATIAGALVQMTAEVLGCNAITLALDDRLARFCVGRYPRTWPRVRTRAAARTPSCCASPRRR